MAEKTYTLSEEQKKEFAGVYVLDIMINVPEYFPVLLEGNDKDLEPVLDWLMAKEYIKIQNDKRYVPSAKGRAVLVNFMKRYTEFLKFFDIYCAVDLEAGEFAFAYYFDFDDDQSWKQFLNDERWDDLRIAVADYKKLDPVEIVFMSFINEGRFGRDDNGWQFDLLLGSVWDDILNICQTAIQWQELGYEDEDEYVDAEDVIQDIIAQGTELMIELLEEEVAYNQQTIEEDYGNGDDQEEKEYIVEKVVIETYPVTYYHPYRDPLYVSPVWRRRWII